MSRVLGAWHIPTGEKFMLDTPMTINDDPEKQSIGFTLSCILHRDFHAQIKRIYKSGFTKKYSSSMSINNFCNILCIDYIEQFEIIYE